MSIRADGLAGEAGDEPAAVGEQHRVGDLQPLDPARVGLLQRGLDDRRADDREVPGPALHERPLGERLGERVGVRPAERPCALAPALDELAPHPAVAAPLRPLADVQRAGGSELLLGVGDEALLLLGKARLGLQLAAPLLRDGELGVEVDPRLRRPAAVRALEHEPGALAGGVRGGDVEEVDVVAAGLAQRVGETAGAEDVELEDVVQRLLEGDGRGAVDGDVGAGELLGVEAAEALGGEVRGQRTQAAGGQRLVGQPTGERLARQDLLHEPLVGRVVVGRAQEQRDRPGARDLSQPGRQDGLAEEPGGACEQQLRVGESYGDALGHGGAHGAGRPGSGPGGTLPASACAGTRRDRSFIAPLTVTWRRR